MKPEYLEGGCYVLAGMGAPGPGLHQVIGPDLGASKLSQYLLCLEDNPPPILSFGNAEVLVLLLKGKAHVNISGKVFEAAPETGLCVRPGEAVEVIPARRKGEGGYREEGPDALSPMGRPRDFEGPFPLPRHDQEAHDVLALVTVAPGGAFRDVGEMPGNFDDKFPERAVRPDPQKRKEMGDRFYQVLAGKRQGASQLTQFIGEIPKSKAPAHHHNYEEALWVLAGEGRMWTGESSAEVKAGSIIYLPKGRKHSLECTSDPGLRVAGHFYPAGSPAENY